MTTTPYVLPVNETISSAWHKVKGSKATLWASLGLVILIAIGFAIIEEVTKAVLPQMLPVVKIISEIINALLQFGVLYIGIRRAYDLPITWDMMFRTFDWNIGLKTIGTYILQILIFIIPAALLFAGIMARTSQISGAAIIAAVLIVAAIFLAVYLAMKLMPAIGFVLDKEANPIQAIKMSFAATRGNFFSLFMIFLFEIIVIFISIFPLFGVGLIWSLPLLVILFGEFYKRLLVNVELPELTG